MSGTITVVSGPITSSQGTKTIGPLYIIAAQPIGQVQDISFAAAGSITPPIPAGATAIIIIPPVGNQVGLILKGVVGDTGIPISPFNPTIISFAGNPTATAIVLTAAGAVANIELSFI